jgi:hypothetical protein
MVALLEFEVSELFFLKPVADFFFRYAEKAMQETEIT